jgi:hypothetical protein
VLFQSPSEIISLAAFETKIVSLPGDELGIKHVLHHTAISSMHLTVGGETLHFISAALSSALSEVTPLNPKFNNDLSKIY